MIAAIAVGLDVTRGPSSYRINAVYSSAPGLFPGAAVDVLGVPVGTVTSVTNVADKVEVGMELHSGARIPTAADASLVAPELLGQPDVDLNPGYTGGAYLRPGATIAESHTSVPVSTDQLLKQLQRTLKELNPDAVGNLVTNLSQDLDGQGAGLNQLIKSAAGTLQLLADKGADLGQLNGTLAQLTGTLDSDTSQIEQLVREYDTVSSVVAQHSGQLNSAITQLSGATTSLVTLLTPNLQPLEADVGTVTTVGRTLRSQCGQRRRDPPTGQQPVPGRPARLRPHLQLARSQPRSAARGHRRLRGRSHQGSPGRGLSTHHGQPLCGAVRRRAGQPRLVRQSGLELLRPADQRHPRHSRHPFGSRRLFGGDGTAATGPRSDRQHRRILERQPGLVYGGTPERSLGQRRRHFRHRRTSGTGTSSTGTSSSSAVLDAPPRLRPHRRVACWGPFWAARPAPRRRARARPRPRATRRRPRHRAGWAGCSPRMCRPRRRHTIRRRSWRRMRRVGRRSARRRRASFRPCPRPITTITGGRMRGCSTSGRTT